MNQKLDIIVGLVSFLLSSMLYVAVSWLHYTAIGADIARKKHVRSFRRHKKERIGFINKLLFLDFFDSVNRFYYAVYIAHLVLGLAVVILLTVIFTVGNVAPLIRYLLGAAFLADAMLFQVAYRAYYQGGRAGKKSPESGGNKACLPEYEHGFLQRRTDP